MYNGIDFRVGERSVILTAALLSGGFDVHRMLDELLRAS
jgi:hypothetical protein